MEPSFAKLLARLANHGVHFLVVGGVAVTLQGYVRLTETVDLLIDGDPSNVRRLLACLADYGEGHARELSPEISMTARVPSASSKKASSARSTSSPA